MFYFDYYSIDELTPREKVILDVIIDELNEKNKSLRDDRLMNEYIN